MEDNQKKLHDDAVHKLSGAFAEMLEGMKMFTALEALTNFYVSEMVRILLSVEEMDVLNGKVIGAEVAERIENLKKMK